MFSLRVPPPPPSLCSSDVAALPLSLKLPKGLDFSHIALGKEFLSGMKAPSLASPTPAAFTALAAGHRHACAVDVEGGFTCWGDDGAVVLEVKPEELPESMSAMALGDGTTCILDMAAALGALSASAPSSTARTRSSSSTTSSPSSTVRPRRFGGEKEIGKEMRRNECCARERQNLRGTRIAGARESRWRAGDASKISEHIYDYIKKFGTGVSTLKASKL